MENLRHGFPPAANDCRGFFLYLHFGIFALCQTCHPYLAVLVQEKLNRDPFGASGKIKLGNTRKGRAARHLPPSATAVPAHSLRNIDGGQLASGVSKVIQKPIGNDHAQVRARSCAIIVGVDAEPRIAAGLAECLRDGKDVKYRGDSHR